MKTEILIHARTHDDARVVSAEFGIASGDTGAVTAELKTGMERIDMWAEANNAIIGHLKGFVSPVDGAVMLSTTGDAVNVEGAITLDIGITGIIFGVPLEDFQAQITELARGIASNFGATGIDVEVCDHDHSHDHDHHHH